MSWGEVTQWFGVALTALGGAVGYGRLQEQVSNNTDDTENFVRKGAYEQFQDEVLRRLRRIEEKQDEYFNSSD